MATDNTHTEEVDSPDIHFEPIVQLPAVEIVTLEEEEEELIQLRAKLYRYDTTLTPAEWKERGTGNVKLLKHKTSNLVRVLMRRDKTLKVCANHYVQPEMELTPNCGSDKAWVWTTPADFSDDETKCELLAIRFANAENAQKWKAKFVEAQEIMKEAIPKHNKTIGKDDTKKTDETEKNDSGAGDNKSNAEEDAKTEASDKEADSVADKLENLTVKESDNKDSVNNKELDTSSNQTDDDKEKEKQ